MANNAKKLGFPWTSETKLRSYRKYSQEMESLSYIGALPADPRETLLRSLYNLARRKIWIEVWANAERIEAPQFRAWRRFVKATQPRLLRALLELRTINEERPRPSEAELLFDADEFLLGLGKIAKRLAHSFELAKELGSVLAALVNPKLRDRTEKGVVRKELYARLALSPRSKASNIDHWLIARAAAILDRCQNAQGKTIARYDRVISKYFQAAFGYAVTDENVRTALRRIRENASPPQSGIPAWDKF
jgi:hypothetical protein